MSEPEQPFEDKMIRVHWLSGARLVVAIIMLTVMLLGSYFVVKGDIREVRAEVADLKANGSPGLRGHEIAQAEQMAQMKAMQTITNAKLDAMQESLNEIKEEVKKLR